MIRADQPKATLDRTFRGSLDELWDLWTTPEGIEAWWAPEGHRVAVRALDLRPGGEFTWETTAITPAQIEWQTKSGIPLTTVQRIVYTEVDPPRHLRYRNIIDFVPGVEPYEVDNEVDFEPTESGVRIVIRFSPLHSDEWTRLATLGYESQLSHLDVALASRR